MKNLQVILTLVFFAFSQHFVAQEENNILKEADSKFDNFEYIDARQVYLDVAKSGFKSENLFKRLGDSYYFNNDLPSALEWYQALSDYNSEMDTEYLFRYAMSLKNAKRYEEADKIMKIYESKIGIQHNVVDKDYYLDIIKKQAGRYKINITSINSESLDFAPSYYMDDLVFTSNRETKHSKKKQDSWTNKAFCDLYKVTLDKSSNPSTEPEFFSKIINSEYHDSSPVFTKDGNTVYFTRNNYTAKESRKKKALTNLLKIYKSTKNDDNKWSKPIALSFNNDNYSCAHPTLNKAEDKMYFSSDLPGTNGQSDIFVVTINEDGTYGIPSPLSSNINTTGRESFPFISDENLLYFSSDGHYGLGGLDVFVSELDSHKNTASEAVNLGEPINSSFDDTSFIYKSSSKTGFFASNRENGTGQDDIYKLIQVEPPITACEQVINGIVTDDESLLPLENVLISIYDENLKRIDSLTTTKNGEYKFLVDCKQNYKIRISVKGYKTSESNVATNGTFNHQNNLDLVAKKGNDIGIIKAYQGDDLGKLLQLDPIYFDFNKSDIRQDAQVELQKITSILTSHPAINIEVRSHTDSRGKALYNLKLSNRRAKSTINYLQNQHINTNRLSATGYGDTQLVNDCVNGKDCSESEHQDNRRSEFIIVTNKSNAANNIQNNSGNKSIISSEKYEDRADDSIIYTVQIGAFKSVKKNAFIGQTDVFYRQYKDGVVRYFSGKFSSIEAAQKHKAILTNKEIKGFVVKLEEDNR